MMEPPQPPLSPLPSLSSSSVPPHTNGTTTPEPNLNGTTPLTNGSASSAATFDPGIMRAFLVSVLPPIFGASREEFEASMFGESKGHNDDFEDHVAHFSMDGGGPLYVTKTREDGEGACRFIYLASVWLIFLIRRLITVVHIYTHFATHIFISRNDCRFHQTRTHPRSVDTFSGAATHN